MTRTNSRSGLFLMEIMLAILFFSIAGALSLNMFAKSRQMSEDAFHLSMASDQVRNAAERLKHAAVSDTEKSKDTFFSECMSEAYPNADETDSGFSVYFDRDWNSCGREEGFFCMEITPSRTKETGLFCCNFSVIQTDGGDTIYSLDVKLHVPNRPQ